jgi:molybdopterin molybdotransferase
MVKANCLIDVPLEIDRLNPGDEVTVQLLSGEAWPTTTERQDSCEQRLSCC